MRSRTANWKECVVCFNKTMEDGFEKRVKESYVLNADTFTEAESRILSEMQPYVKGDLDVYNINPCKFGEIFFSDKENADKWFSARLQFITIDERMGKEKKQNIHYLVQASTFEGAKKNIEEVMNGTMIDYVIAKIEETKIVDVFECKDE